MSDTDLKRCDFIEFSKMCGAEYNKPELSDRVLVFDVMEDGWETATVLSNVLATEANETAASVASMREYSSQKQSMVEETHETESHKIETREDLGNPTENESKDPVKLASEQDSKPSQLDSPKAPLYQESTEDVASTTQTPISSYTNEPLRQHKIYVHSFWLSVQSPYFRSLFYSSGMKESRYKEVHVKVSQSDENAHLTLLEAIYRDDVLKDKTVDQLLAVLELANKYDLKLVFKKCKYVLQENATTFQICSQIMHVIKVKHNFDDVEDLIKILQPIIVKEFCPLDEKWGSMKFTSLSEPSIKYLLSSDDLIVQSENTVFHALMYWMEQNEIDPKETTDLLAVVRFQLVTTDYIYNVIKNHPIASKMIGFKDLLLDGVMYQAVPSQQKRLLEEQPVLRKKPERNIIHYIGEIEKREYDTALQEKTELHSETFWACGYKISAGLNPSSHNNVFLIVHSLKKGSYVPLKFSILSESEKYIYWKDRRFTVDSCRENFKNNKLPGSAFENGDTLTFCVAVAIP